MQCAAGTPSDTGVRDLVDEQQYKLLLTYLDKVLDFNQHTNLTGMLLEMGCCIRILMYVFRPAACLQTLLHVQHEDLLGTALKAAVLAISVCMQRSETEIRRLIATSMTALLCCQSWTSMQTALTAIQ